ncbi:MAG TPA: AMP-binding protein [Candidatus Eisenbacteria bacterium]|nr:AMP-binding protein [Candidatus Eisenbacteria bacterium]
MNPTRKFIAARQFLLDNRTDYEKACREFRWPDLSDFNWARDWFDVYAQGNSKTALWLLRESGEEVRFTYQELAERSDRVAHFLQRKGVEPGDRIVLCLPNVAAIWELMLAAIKIGAVVVPTTTLATESEIRDRLERSGARIVVTEEGLLDRIPPDAEVTRIVVGGQSANWTPYESSLEESPSCQAVHTKATDPFLLYFTSGTTAKAKLVLHTHQSYPVGHLSTMYWIGIQESDIHQNISSPGWAKHAWSCVFAPWNAGATTFVYDAPRFRPANSLRAVDEVGVNTLCAPPTVWRMLIRDDLGKKPRGLRELASAGEPLNPEVIDQVEKAWGLVIRDGYGQTETTALIGNSPGQVVKLGSMGRPLPGFQIMVVDLQDKECQEGEVAVNLTPRPTGLMTGYMDDPDRTQTAMQNGLYHTGDQAFVDENGYFFFVGRGDDVFKSSDYRISPFELESALMEHPLVAEVAIVPSSDPIRTNVPKAFITMVAGSTPSEETARDILLFAKEKLAAYKRVRKLEFHELPKTISGKIRRAELRKLEAQRVKDGERSSLEFWLKDFE